MSKYDKTDVLLTHTYLVSWNPILVTNNRYSSSPLSRQGYNKTRHYFITIILWLHYPNIISSGLSNVTLLHWYLSKEWCKDLLPCLLLQCNPLCIPPVISSIPPATLHPSVPSCNSPNPVYQDPLTLCLRFSLSCWGREDNSHLSSSAPTLHFLNFQNKHLYVSFQVSPSVKRERPQNTHLYDLLNPSFFGEDDNVQRPLHHVAPYCFFVCPYPPRQQYY